MVHKVLNLGAGVQSTTLLLMSCRGELPRLECAIFADTKWESKATYEHLAWLESEAANYGIPIHRVSTGNIREDAVISQVRGKKADGQRWASMPMRTIGPDGSVGMIKRQCTSEYKIAPIERFIRREILCLKPRKHAPKEHAVDQWFGISSDEAHRAKMAKTPWQRFVYPLLGLPTNMLLRPWTRHMCLRWLAENYPDRQVPRSACIGCPFHSNEEWRLLTKSEFADACEVDEAIRHCGGMRSEMFLHQAGIPLINVDLGRNQGDLWGEECGGYCGT